MKKSSKPGAWIVNPKDKGRKPIKKGNVYLKNGQEFEIELFNPLRKSILVDIRLNGNSISEGGLVIKPGQREYLDCFIDDKKKFKFETYQVEDSEDSKNAISDNGLLEIFFYKEDVIKFDNWRDSFHKKVIREYYPIYIERYPYWYYPLNYNTFYGDINTTVSDSGGTFNINNDSNNNCTSYYSDNITLTSNNTFNSNVSASYGTQINTTETGRVEKGGKSKQNFYEVDMDFEENYIHSIVYKILPESQKPTEIKKSKKKKKVNADMIDLLHKLGELKDCEILTEEEFLEKKKEILKRI